MAAILKRGQLPPHATPEHAQFEVDVISGLMADPKRIAPKYFYDAEGSRLFEEITRQPEYYPTRTEIGILRAHAGEIVKLIPPGAALVEFGSGACTKVAIVIEAAALAAYVPVDISGEFLKRQAARLAASHPRLSVHPVVTDFSKPFALPEAVKTMQKAGFFPGSTIGNFEPHDAASFLRNACRVLGLGSFLIVGVDLVKEPEILNAAYNDAAGVTAKFNLNLLRRINRELDGNFDLRKFEHHAFYNRERRRVEMHIASTMRQKVNVAGTTASFRPGESIHTENSYKYTLGSFSALARGAGWMPQAVWTDPAHLFSVHLLRAR